MLDILIPVYNVERYVGRCLDSILNQSCQDYRVIIVNDASTDDSIEIVRRYEDKFKDKLLIFENATNCGLSYTRNRLVQLATSEYFIFVDSDDSLNSKLVEVLANVINSSKNAEPLDLIRFQSLLIKAGQPTVNKYDSPIFSGLCGEEALLTFLEADKIFAQSWMYCYRRKFFVDNNFLFPIGRVQEDFALTFKVIFLAKRVTSISYEGYNYYRNPNSIMENKSREMSLVKAYDVLFHYDAMVVFFENTNFFKKHKELFLSFIGKAVIVKLKYLDDDDFNKFMEEIRKRKIDEYNSDYLKSFLDT